MPRGSARRAPAPTPTIAPGDGSALALALAELVRVVREEARAAVREELAAERARQTEAEADGWLTTAEVAGRLGRAGKTIRYWITARGLPAQKHLGVWRVRQRDLDAFITGGGDQATRSVAASILAGLHTP